MSHLFSTRYKPRTGTASIRQIRSDIRSYSNTLHEYSRVLSLRRSITTISALHLMQTYPVHKKKYPHKNTPSLPKEGKKKKRKPAVAAAAPAQKRQTMTSREARVTSEHGGPQPRASSARCLFVLLTPVALNHLKSETKTCRRLL